MRKSKNSNRRGTVYYVANPADFKLRNLAEWHANSEFWLQGQMRHIADVYDTVVIELRAILLGQNKPGERVVVIDTGCGEGWAIKALDETGYCGQYVGLDFNERFVEHLKKKYAADSTKEFRVQDLEELPPTDLQGSADLVLNFFNLFELPQLDVAMRNISNLVAPGGSLLILHIDPMTQLLAVSSSLDDYHINLGLYEQHRNRLGYDKDIDIGRRRSGRFYRSLLYSAADLVRCARAQGMRLENLHEIVKTGNSIPQIYQVLHFVRCRG